VDGFVIGGLTEFAAILPALHGAIVTPQPQVPTSVSVEEIITIIETPLGTVTEISDRVEIRSRRPPRGRSGNALRNPLG
jgi:hypothetical protein